MDLTRTDEALADDHWIGPAPSPMAIIALLVMGTVGMEIIGVQPVVLGALVEEHRLTVAGLGWATTAELLAFGIVISLAGALLKPRSLRALATLTSFIVLVADLLVTTESGMAIVVNRGVAGLAEGLMVWITSCMIARSPTPARWSGIFLTLQGAAQLAFTAIVPLTLMNHYGADGGFAVLAGTAALALSMVPFIPAAFTELPTNSHSDVLAVFSSPSAIASLFSVFLVASFSIGLFAYLAPLSAQALLSPKILGFAVSGVLAASIMGSTVAATVAKRMSYYPIFLLSVFVNAAIIVILNGSPTATTFIAASAVFGFFWVFFLPFQLPLVIESDPTRRIAMVLPGAQLLGGAFGPFLCSFFVKETDARGALAVAGLCFLLAFAISTVLHVNHRRTARSRDHLQRMA